MRYYSTRSKQDPVNFAAAALTGLAPDGGLYVPEEIPALPRGVIQSLGTMDYQDMAREIIKPFVAGEIPESILGDLVQSAYPFKPLLLPVGESLVLELFHGPTAAFKDFGARFMARSFSYLRRNADRPLQILVATSGDTGGAVADGFFDIPGIFVTVLYPKGRVTPLQEKQIAGLGKNISAIAVEGSFDDCQALVKRAFSDGDLKKKRDLSSANSINISRLIPQAVYYAYAAGRALGGVLDEDGDATPRRKGHRSGAGLSGGRAIICVPSGNFGNLTAGLYALKMGSPIAHFIAATNINKTVPDYLDSGDYRARPSEATISNAMDVGAPSNFERMASHWSHSEMKGMISGVAVTDEDTRNCIKRVFEGSGYYLDPHGAVGWKAMEEASGGQKTVVLATAHPAKFQDTVEPLVGPAPTPPVLSQVMSRETHSFTIKVDQGTLKEVLLSIME